MFTTLAKPDLSRHILRYIFIALSTHSHPLPLLFSEDCGTAGKICQQRWLDRWRRHYVGRPHCSCYHRRDVLPLAPRFQAILGTAVWQRNEWARVECVKVHDCDVCAVWDPWGNGVDQGFITDSPQCILCPLQFSRERKKHMHTQNKVLFLRIYVVIQFTKC